MARSRIIKPGFFTNDILGELDPLCRLLFVGLWCIADREGRLIYRPKKIKIEILPYDNFDIEIYIKQLLEKGFIQIYGDKELYIQIINWQKHQHVHPKEIASIIPLPPSSSISTSTSTSTSIPCFIHDSCMTHASTMHESCMKTAPKTAPLVALSADADARNEEIVDIFNHWKEKMEHPRSKLDAKRRKIIKRALELGYSVDDLKQAIDGCKVTPHNMGHNDNGETYDDIALICRDATHIDRFKKNFLKPPIPKSKTKEKEQEKEKYVW